MRNLFARSKAPGRAAQVKDWASQHLELTEADLVSVAELACHEPGCPPVETVVTVHGSDGERRTWHIHIPLSDINQADIEAALTRIE